MRSGSASPDSSSIRNSASGGSAFSCALSATRGLTVSSICRRSPRRSRRSNRSPRAGGSAPATNGLAAAIPTTRGTPNATRPAGVWRRAAFGDLAGTAASAPGAGESPRSATDDSAAVTMRFARRRASVSDASTKLAATTSGWGAWPPVRASAAPRPSVGGTAGTSGPSVYIVAAAAPMAASQVSAIGVTSRSAVASAGRPAASMPAQPSPSPRPTTRAASPSAPGGEPSPAPGSSASSATATSGSARVATTRVRLADQPRPAVAATSSTGMTAAAATGTAKPQPAKNPA